jgi:hypothetical protein
MEPGLVSVLAAMSAGAVSAEEMFIRRHGLCVAHRLRRRQRDRSPAKAGEPPRAPPAMAVPPAPARSPSPCLPLAAISNAPSAGPPPRPRAGPASRAPAGADAALPPRWWPLQPVPHIDPFGTCLHIAAGYPTPAASSVPKMWVRLKNAFGASWMAFLRHRNGRGLTGVRLLISDPRPRRDRHALWGTRCSLDMDRLREVAAAAA